MALVFSHLRNSRCGLVSSRGAVVEKHDDCCCRGADGYWGAGVGRDVRPAPATVRWRARALGSRRSTSCDVQPAGNRGGMAKREEGEDDGRDHLGFCSRSRGEGLDGLRDGLRFFFRAPAPSAPLPDQHAIHWLSAREVSKRVRVGIASTLTARTNTTAIGPIW